ncbi:hypothetical protein ACQRIT_007287 [Beauveria bassiana]
MTSILRWAQQLTRKTPLQPLRFPTTGFDIIPDSALLEEEQLDEFKEDKYFPVQIGHVYASKYQVLGLWELLLGLDYLHAECKLVHTDIKADNIHSELVDKQLFEAFTQAELERPTPRKYINGFPIYLSREFGLPRELGNVILSDFGAAVRGDERRNHDAQPNVYRSPEVMLKVRWSYPVDIWNVGVMIWDLFEGKHLFYGDDPSGEGYLTRAHLAEGNGRQESRSQKG